MGVMFIGQIHRFYYTFGGLIWKLSVSSPLLESAVHKLPSVSSDWPNAQGQKGLPCSCSGRIWKNSDFNLAR